VSGYEEEETPPQHPWRRWVIAGVALALVTVLFAGPIWGAVQRSQPRFAANGLQVCGLDYCVVQESVIAAGYGATMTQLAGIRLDAGEAQAFADDLTGALGEREVTVELVGPLPGDLAGRYDARRRLIEVEEPITAWTIVHEVAHVAASGHDAGFQQALLDLVIVVATR